MSASTKASRRRSLGMALLALGATSVLACDDKALPPTPSASATAASSGGAASTSSARPTPPSYEDAKLHVPADYEVDAESSITADNYKQALAELHEEITGNPAPAASGSAAASAAATAVPSAAPPPSAPK